MHRAWSFDRVERFARYLETVTSSLARADDEESREFAARVLDQATGFDDPDLGIVDRLELQRIARGFARGFEPDQLRQYALENRLVVPESQHADRATSLGQSFLRLRGKDAIQWLLTVEVSQSTGHRDRWRTPR